MIIECNACKKSFKVPDNAITPTGRLVQCSSCGNKWTQYPQTNDKVLNKTSSKIVKNEKKEKKLSKVKKNKIKKVNPYSKEYLSKKHGLKIIDPSSNPLLEVKNDKFKKIKNQRITFGFYSYILILIIIIISLFGVLNLTKEIIIENYPMLEIHINYLYETLNNIKIIFSDIISNY